MSLIDDLQCDSKSYDRYINTVMHGKDARDHAAVCASEHRGRVLVHLERYDLTLFGHWYSNTTVTVHMIVLRCE